MSSHDLENPREIQIVSVVIVDEMQIISQRIKVKYLDFFDQNAIFVKLSNQISYFMYIMQTNDILCSLYTTSWFLINTV